MNRALAQLLALLFVLAGCTSAATNQNSSDLTDLDKFYAQEIAWKKCGRFLCGELLVPIDYKNPEAGVFKLALTKVSAKQTANRIGNLVLNPGGPGGSGIDFAQGGLRSVSNQILNRFDLIGFDPRGVGKSDPVRCLSDQETDDFLAADETPDDPDEIEIWNNWVDRFAQACKEQNADTWRHIGSWNVARDMDVIRAALGDEKLNWLGKSYGTLLGGLYAQLFPERVGKFVLDGPVDPNSEPDQSVIQITAFEVALNRFITDCLTRRSCPLSGTVETAYQQLLDFVFSLDQTPLAISDNRYLTESHATTAVLVGLYDDQDLWPFLRDALAQAFDGDGEYLMLLSDLINARDPDGKYIDNSLAALYAVNCVDYADALTPTELPTEVNRLSKISRFFGPLFGWGSSACLGWMNQDLELVTELSAQPVNAVLIIGTTYDPATPIAWAVALQQQISGSVLVEWKGEGHTGYRRGSSCVDELVDRYLISNELPTSGTVCPALSNGRNVR